MNKKILISLSIFLIVSTIIISVYQTFLFREKSHKNREFSFLEILSEKSYSIEQKLKPLSNSIDSLTELLLSDKQPLGSNLDILTESFFHLKNDELIDIIFILDSSGQCIFSTDSLLYSNNYRLQPYFRNVKKLNSYIYPAFGVKTKKIGIYYSKAINENDNFLGTIVLKIKPQIFSSEMRWQKELPSNLEGQIYSGLLTSDNILLTTKNNKLYHLSSLSETLSNKLKKNKQFKNNDIINLKLINDDVSFSYIENHRILHRHNIYQEEFILFSNPFHNGELLLLHIIPHSIFEKFFDNKKTFIEATFNLLSAPFFLIVLLILMLIFTTISYKKIINDLIDTSNIKAAEAAVAGIEKDEFLATVTHELRTPLNGIMGITTLLKNSSPTSKQEEYLNMITACSTSLLKTINDVLDISKIKSGILSLAQTPFSLPVLIHEVLTPIEQDAHKKGLSFLVDLESDLPEQIVGDSERLKQLLDCFLLNAIKFTDEGSIQFLVKKLSSETRKCTITFIVIDTGIGISQEDQEKMFETFTQVEMSTTRLYGGMGLGLSIAKSLSDLMKGNITLKSIPGKGSTFSFTGTFSLTDVSQSNKETL